MTLDHFCKNIHILILQLLHDDLNYETLHSSLWLTLIVKWHIPEEPGLVKTSSSGFDQRALGWCVASLGRKSCAVTPFTRLMSGQLWPRNTSGFAWHPFKFNVHFILHYINVILQTGSQWIFSIYWIVWHGATIEAHYVLYGGGGGAARAAMSRC